MTTLLEIVPSTFDTIEVPSAEASAFIAARYARRDEAYVRLNMITSLNGAAAGGDGTSDSITSPVDRTLLRAIRDDADIVLVGAQTVRAEGYVLPATALLAVVTASGDLGGHRFVPRVADDGNGSGGDGSGSGSSSSASAKRAQARVLILCPEGSPAHRNGVQLADGITAEIIAIPAGPTADAQRGDTLPPAAIIEALAARGHRRVVCEGGPTLTAQFVAAGVIDEFCLTVAPTIEVGGSALFAVSAGARPDTEVAGMLVDDAGFSYLRLRVRRAAPATPATT